MISMTEKENSAYAAGTRCRRKPIVPQITKATAEKLGLTPGCEIVFHYTVIGTGEEKLRKIRKRRKGTVTDLLRAHFPHYMGRGKVEGMLCLQHAAKERRKLDRG